MASGIYEIRNRLNNKIYIGSSKDLEKRFRTHKSCLRTKRHFNSHLQNAWNRYGEEIFNFTILLLTEDEELNYYEQKYIDILKPQYNIRLENVNRNTRIKRTEETKNKLSKTLTGRKIPFYPRPGQHGRVGKLFEGIMFISPDGERFSNVQNLTQFFKPYGIQIKHLWNLIHGKVTHHRGWRIEYVDIQ